jgi:hypothetical protein
MHVLGRYAFIPENELQGVTEDWKHTTVCEEEIQYATEQYMYEVYKDADRRGWPIPSHAIDLLRKMQEEEQKNEVHDSSVRKVLWESPMMQEIADIQRGRWSGKPHWTVNDR